MTPLNVDHRSGYGDNTGLAWLRGGGRRLTRGITMVALVAGFTAGCASTGAVPRPFPQPPRADRTRETADAPLGPIETFAAGPVLETALALLGSPYLDGGATPKGFDCSGFTQWVFAQHGVALPRETRDQFSVGTPVGVGSVASGDLLFFSTVAPGPSHVAIALDEDRFVHAPSARGVVRVERLSVSYWQQHFIGARRVERGD